jgi:RHS repeat-associated protein
VPASSAAYQSSTDSYRYDTGAFAAAASTTPATDVELETTLGSPVPEAPSTLNLRASPGQTAHLHSSTLVDFFGNATDAIDAGCVAGCTTSDETITRHTTPGRPACDPGGWMWRTVESDVAGSSTGAGQDQTSMSYECGGQLAQTTAQLVGSLALDRFHQTVGASVAPPPPAASHDGTIAINAMTYDSVGFLVHSSGANGQCRDFVSDARYGQFPTRETDYVGTPQTGVCGGVPLITNAQYDRGLGALTQATDPNGEITSANYDAFGRVATLTKPNPDPCQARSLSPVPALQVQYLLPSDAAATPFSTIVTSVQDGVSAGDATYRQVVTLVDGLGRSILAGEQADPSAGDPAPWIVDQVTTYDAKGAAAVVHQPWFAATMPPSLPLEPASASSHARFDAFGRAIETYGIDGAQTLRNVYHAVSVDRWDAADLQAGGPHQGTFATEVHDGHGRSALVIERVHNGSAIEQHATRTQYRAAGQPLVISRERAGSSSVVRWLQYDSLGRMVLNVEPDATAGFVSTPGPPPPTMHAWQYAYDNSGDLVGTSDARGCGANYLYDAGPRIVAEDFSPCLASQPVYSPPDLTTGNGTEAFYQYDGYAGVNVPAVTTTGFPPADLARGKLVSISDRGARTVTSYDGRGNPIAVARLVASPAGPTDTLAARYAPTWSVRTVAYDGADRPVVTTTGADLADLLPAPGSPSTVTTQYSQRGTVSSVTSSYGSLVASVGRDADGLVNQLVYGDAAKTTSALSYDARRRLSSVQTYRGPPAIWSQVPAAYLPAPAPGGAPSTFQLLLEDVDYHYDVVDNPVEIDDWRMPSEWPAGAQPVSRKVQYDDLYRATRVDYVYPGGTDPWTSPFDAEDPGSPPDPRLAPPSPHVHFSNRILSQSFQYDWLGNTTATDDDVHGFYDRSLGTIGNGTASAGPYQLKSATGSGTLGGNLTTVYDAAGELTSLAVNRSGPCLPSSAHCAQRFVYDWDEVGRLARARRWDLASAGLATDLVPGGAANVDLGYLYDATDNRVLKTATDAANNRVFTAYIFSSLELRRAPATADGTDYMRNDATEVAYLDAHGVRLARLHAAYEALPELGGKTLHVLLEMPDHLGSTSIVVDRDTSEVVERGTYTAYGQAESDYRPARWGSFREDYRFTGKEDDVEVGLQYFGKRYLAAELTRWMSVDPMTMHGLAADPNGYAYVHGMLLEARDSLGLAEDDVKGVSFNAENDPSGTTNAQYATPQTDAVVASYSQANACFGQCVPPPAPTGPNASIQPAPNPNEGNGVRFDDPSDGMPAFRAAPTSPSTPGDFAGFAPTQPPPYESHTPTVGEKQDELVRDFAGLASLAVPFLEPEVLAGAGGSTPATTPPPAAAASPEAAGAVAEARSVGAMAADERLLNWSPKSTPTWGHTFLTHGEAEASSLAGRAAGTGQAQGMWLNNEAAAQFLSAERPYIQGPASVRLPEGLGQIIRPNGSIGPATRATLVPAPGGGFRTAFPIE